MDQYPLQILSEEPARNPGGDWLVHTNILELGEKSTQEPLCEVVRPREASSGSRDRKARAWHRQHSLYAQDKALGIVQLRPVFEECWRYCRLPDATDDDEALGSARKVLQTFYPWVHLLYLCYSTCVTPGGAFGVSIENFSCLLYFHHCLPDHVTLAEVDAIFISVCAEEAERVTSLQHTHCVPQPRGLPAEVKDPVLLNRYQFFTALLHIVLVMGRERLALGQ